MLSSAAALFDLLGTTEPPADTARLFRTVHVLGGGIAGLMAARVLADHADRVVILEPDGQAADSGTEPRPGVPQGYQVHNLLPGGRAQLERFFPGIVQQILAAGAIHCTPDRAVVYLDNVEQIRTPNTELILNSRPFLESIIRRRTLALPGVEVVRGRVSGLGFADGAVRVVRYVTGTNTKVAQPTDFVVDATGRGSRLPEWLAEAGWPRPETKRVGVDVQYFTTRFKRPSDWAGPYAAMVRQSPGSQLPEAVFIAIEGDQWALMLTYYQSNGERVDPDDIVSRLAVLPAIFTDVAAGELTGPVVPYRHPDSRWRQFHDLSRLPARLAVVGDSVASFNPVFGQGMSCAALHASCLSEYLRSGPDPDAPARYFFQLQKVITEAAWQTSTATDLARLGATKPPTTEQEHRRAWAMRQVMAAARQDVEIATAVRAVSFMTAHPDSLTVPALVRRAAQINQVPEEEFRREYAAAAAAW
jgi:2-polyprenyl-6-methoxyphenol hydroxylase-like FAD-dependent oxidoreductase